MTITEIALQPINRQARNFLSSGKTIPLLRAALTVCGEKLASSVATRDIVYALQNGNNELEYKIKITKDNSGQFSVKMVLRTIKYVENHVDMKHLESGIK